MQNYVPLLIWLEEIQTCAASHSISNRICLCLIYQPTTYFTSDSSSSMCSVCTTVATILVLCIAGQRQWLIVEVVSCLDHYLTTTLHDVDSLMLFSDSCPGQNKNSIVMHYLFSLVRMGKFKLIRHFFPLRGHSFLPCDRDFAKTETKKRKD